MWKEIKEKVDSSCYFFAIVGATLTFCVCFFLALKSGALFSIIGLGLVILSPIIGAFIGGMIFGVFLAFPLIVVWEVLILPIVRILNSHNSRHH